MLPPSPLRRFGAKVVHFALWWALAALGYCAARYVVAEGVSRVLAALALLALYSYGKLVGRVRAEAAMAKARRNARQLVASWREEDGGIV